MNGYSIFSHAQGDLRERLRPEQPASPPVVPEQRAKPPVAPEQPAAPAVPRRVRSPRGWAVEAGLGLGPQFKD